MSFTFSMIKPTAVEQGLVGAILNDIERSGFKIKKLQMINLNRDLVEKFYESLNTKPFFGELCNYTISGTIVAMVLEKNNAVQDFRQLIGTTDPNEANYGTIRKKFAVDKMRNAVHGSDSNDNAEREAEIIFG
ncbi:MAG: nucleoside-diphosphate kinase [Cytophagales bacterium]|jgi:nucleoside-diphosphate kinase|nr:nucleoside-diphosphate kinase [Cytophagales bacterium]